MRKIAFIGCGARSVSYAEPLAAVDGVVAAGLADPSPRQRTILKSLAKLPADTPEYDDWRDLLADRTDLDGVVIASPTQFHVDQAIACYERGLPIALEKPVAQCKSECERLLEAERANNGRSLIGFVLRSTPYFSAVHRLVSGGRIGRVVSIQADEMPGWFVTSVMFRSPWRRHLAQSGGSMLEKCCHDMDVMNWITGCRPVSINSYGGRLAIHPNPELPDTCSGCRLADVCKYYQDPRITHEEGEGILAFEREDLRCIYNVDSDVADVQSVVVEYETGAIANFLLNFHTAGPRAGRNLHIVGTRGRIWGNMEQNTLRLYENSADRVEEVPIATDESGHGGGDRAHAMLFHRMVQDPAFRPEQDATAGYLSAVMCFAADRSMAERRRMELRYRGDGFVELV